MPEFQWDPTSDDPMGSGEFDTSSEPTPVAPPKKPSIPKPAPKPVQKAPVAVTQVLDELEDSPDPAELSEAEWRLEKAGYYRDIINSQLLSSEHPAAIEVETELQDWARGRLEQLLGIRSDPMAGVQGPPMPKLQLPFTEEEIEVLKSLAERALARQATQPPVPVVTPPAPKKPVTPVAVAKSVPKITPVEAPAKRGRGRPRKPCRICGELACGHKRQPTQPAAVPQAAPTVSAKLPEKNDPTTGEVYDGVPIKLMPDGTKYIDAPNGRRYKLERRQVTHKETGEVRDAYMPIELSPPKDTSASVKPFPSEAEAMAMAANEAQRNSGRVAALTTIANVGGVPQKITGQTLIDAAMKAEPKESYIPEAPSRKR